MPYPKYFMKQGMGLMYIVFRSIIRALFQVIFRVTLCKVKNKEHKTDWFHPSGQLPAHHLFCSKGFPVSTCTTTHCASHLAHWKLVKYSDYFPFPFLGRCSCIRMVPQLGQIHLRLLWKLLFSSFIAFLHFGQIILFLVS